VGLIKTAAKVAVASHVHGRVQRRQQQRWAAEDQRAAAAQGQARIPTNSDAAPIQSSGGRLAELKTLGELKESGVLTDAEFEAEKARILSR
jgi:hypothetical protein